MYSLVIGVLAAVALAILVLAMKMSDLTQGIYTRDTAEYQEAVAERIRPVGQVYLPGEEQTAEAPVVEAVAEPEPVATAMTGPQVYNTACLACHSTGVGGSPVVGEVAEFATVDVEKMEIGFVAVAEILGEGHPSTIGRP